MVQVQFRETAAPVAAPKAVAPAAPKAAPAAGAGSIQVKPVQPEKYSRFLHPLVRVYRLEIL